MPDRMTPLQVFFACFTIASFGGLASLLRSGQTLTKRSVATAMLYSGIFGLVIGLVWFQFFNGKDNVFFLIGVSGLAGLGGTTLLDFIVQLVSKGGVSIIVRTKSNGERKNDRDKSDKPV